jgi:hypothetical protein
VSGLAAGLRLTITTVTTENATMRQLLPMIALTMTLSAQAQTPNPAPQADSFEREAAKVLQASHANKRGVVVHVNGEAIAGIVKAIGPDSVVLANQQYGTIVVRRERIDAVEGQ